MSGGPTRVKVPACIHPETYKYFFPADRVSAVWSLLEEHYGPIRQNPAFGVMEIQAPKFFFRATLRANPITVIRTRVCAEQDVDHLHELIGFQV